MGPNLLRSSRSSSSAIGLPAAGPAALHHPDSMFDQKKYCHERLVSCSLGGRFPKREGVLDDADFLPLDLLKSFLLPTYEFSAFRPCSSWYVDLSLWLPWSDRLIKAKVGQLVTHECLPSRHRRLGGSTRSCAHDLRGRRAGLGPRCHPKGVLFMR
jgi:hypothetical protein